MALMKMELRWLASISASYTHAAAAMLRGWPMADSTLEAAMRPHVDQLDELFKTFNLPAKATMRNLVPLSAANENLRDLADLVIIKTVGRIEHHSRATVELQGALRELELAFQQAEPDALNNLELRSRPLREQWDARGPGLLRSIGHLTDENLMVPRADIMLVHPACGGSGEAHLFYNSVRIEAVLANVTPQLPETLRLGWLLAQLNLDVPIYAEALRRNRLPLVASLAMLPPALAAGEQLELTQFDDTAIRFALEAWRLPVGDFDRTADALRRWWETYQAKRPSMGVALAALDRMID